MVLGGALAWRRSWLIWVHIPCVLWGAWIEFSGRVCPLTPLENWLRIQAGEVGYEGGFVEHYLLPVLYPSGLTREVQIGLGLVVIAINVAIYGGMYIRSRRKDAGSGPPSRRS